VRGQESVEEATGGEGVNDDDVFYFNTEFTDPRAKVHINSIQAKETVIFFSFPSKGHL